MKFHQVLLGLFALIFATSSPAPVRTGNTGGDDVRLLITESRDLAVRRVQGVKTCAFRIDAPAETRSWILANQTELAQDIGASKHVIQ